LKSSWGVGLLGEIFETNNVRDKLDVLNSIYFATPKKNVVEVMATLAKMQLLSVRPHELARAAGLTGTSDKALGEAYPLA
jgi:hypothetical protein